ncbi:MAG: SAM-dependent methyltransferase [Pseudoprimorskyibacter sp.]|nr:SAM-dependent methyltransferase [Pseudoprimorskyibacter sp.]
MTPKLTDSKALLRNRARAQDSALFLHRTARSEIEDRLTLVNRSFTNPAVVSPFPHVWDNFDAKIIPDTPTLDLDTGQHDLIIHALALHWADDPLGQLIQCTRALQPDGLMMAVSFGGQTLHQLRSCLAEAEIAVTGGLSPRIVPMAEIRDLGALLQRAGLALPVADTLPLNVSYASPVHLMRELRYMGEGNALNDRLRRPTSRQVLFQAAALYSQRFSEDDGRISAQFDLIFLHGWCPADSQPKPLRPGSASHRLADALQTNESKLKD